MAPTITKFFAGGGCDTAGLESQVSETCPLTCDAAESPQTF